MRRLIQISLAALVSVAALNLFPDRFPGLTGYAAVAAEKSPTAVYMEYRKVLMAATAVDAIVPFMSKKVVKEITETPDNMKSVMFALLKATTPKDVETTSEKIDGDTAKITLVGQPSTPQQGSSTKEQGTVDFVREEGNWKIEKEEWKANTVITDSPAPPPTKEESAEGSK